MSHFPRRFAANPQLIVSLSCAASLYSDPATRTNVRDILSTLFDSPDRDVRQPVEEFCAAADRSPASDSTISATPTPTSAVPPMPLPAPVEARPDEPLEDSNMQDVNETGPTSSSTDNRPGTSSSGTVSEEDVDMAELIGEKDVNDEDYEEDGDGGFVEVSKAECA